MIYKYIINGLLLCLTYFWHIEQQAIEISTLPDNIPSLEKITEYSAKAAKVALKATGTTICGLFALIFAYHGLRLFHRAIQTSRFKVILPKILRKMHKYPYSNNGNMQGQEIYPRTAFEDIAEAIISFGVSALLLWGTKKLAQSTWQEFNPKVKQSNFFMIPKDALKTLYG